MALPYNNKCSISFIFLTLYSDFNISLLKSSYCHVFWVSWLIITGSGLDDWIYWHFYYNYSSLQSIITANNRWLPKTRSIHYWTTSVFFLVFLLLWLTWFWFANPSLTNHQRRMNSTGLCYICPLKLSNNSSFITPCEPKRDHHLEQFVSYNLCIRCYGYRFLASRCLAMDCSDFQATSQTRS
jgi:hypothetical protein